MAETLTISTTAGTVNLLSAANQTATGYFADYLPSIGDGRESDSTTTDTFPLYVNGTSRGDLASKLNTLQQYFQQAQTWQENKSGPRVFANWQPEGYAAARRSEIVAGSYYLAPGFKTQFSEAKGHHALVSVEMTRRNWWEGAEATATITHTNASTATYNDGSYGTATTKYVNYWDIDASAIAGDLPAPCRFYYGIGDGTIKFDSFSISITRSQARLANGAAEPNWFEGMDATPTSNANYTGGGYCSYTVDSLNKDLTIYEGGTLLATYIQNFAYPGQYRLFCNVAGTAAFTERVQWFLYDYPNANSMYIDFENTPYFNTLDMGLKKVPFGSSGYREISDSTALSLYFPDASTGRQINADWFHFVRTDGYVRYIIPITSATAKDAIEHDQIDGEGAYIVTSSQKDLSASIIGGKDIELRPGFWHRYYFHPIVFSGYPKSVYITPTIYYRPRYLCL